MLCTLILIELSKILERYSVNIQDLYNFRIDSKVFDKLASKIQRWERIAPELGITYTEMVEIQKNQPSDYRQAKIEFLALWSKNMKSIHAHATGLALVEALLATEDREGAEAVIIFIESKIKFEEHMCSKSQNPHTCACMRSVHPERTYKNWTTMNDAEKKELKEWLIVESHEIKIKFHQVFGKIMEGFLSNHKAPNLSDVKVALLNYFPSATIQAKIEDLSSEDDYQIFIARKCSWLNHHVLEYVLAMSKGMYKDEMDLLMDYKESHLKPYLSRSIFMIPSDLDNSHTTSDDAVLCLKLVDDIDLTGNEAVMIKANLAKLMNLQSLKLSKYDNGSIYLFFSINRDVFQSSYDALKQYIIWSEDHQVYMIMADIALILYV